MIRLRINKTKNWKRKEIDNLKILINEKSNSELCEIFNINLSTLSNALTKYNIKRDEEFVKKLKSQPGELNCNWRGGISQDGARYSRIQRERHPEHKAARDAVYRAVKEGRLIKPSICQDCGEEKSLQGHHESYDKDKYLDVIWVCRKCHRIRHEGKH